MNCKTGGAAFPRPASNTHDPNTGAGHRDIGAEGMSLRDYYIGQALGGFCGGSVLPNLKDFPELLAHAADAAMAARKRQ